jgi:hypothetical protein
MKTVQLYIILVLIVSCTNSVKTKYEQKNIVHYEYEICTKSDSTIVSIHLKEPGERNKLGLLSDRIISEVYNKQPIYFKYIFQDTVIHNFYDLLDASETHSFFLNNEIKREADRILSELSVPEVVMYDNCLYDIMKYEAKLNGEKVVNFSWHDVSILSILINRKLYENSDTIPEKYKTQNKYFRVLPIWCQDRLTFPLFDSLDLNLM